MISAFFSLKLDGDNEFVKKTHEIILSLSSKENLALFQMASSGVKYNFFLLEKEGISRKKYYRGLKMLKDAGLVRKFGNRYLHTTFGRLIYHEMLKIERYTNHSNEMKMIDVLKDSGQFSQNEMSAFINKVSDRVDDLPDIAKP